MTNGMHVVSKGGKKGIQEVQGVIVNKQKGEFVFNYNTSLDPAPEHIELLKNFRNKFVYELEKLNTLLGALSKLE